MPYWVPHQWLEKVQGVSFSGSKWVLESTPLKPKPVDYLYVCIYICRSRCMYIYIYIHTYIRLHTPKPDLIFKVGMLARLILVVV